MEWYWILLIIYGSVCALLIVIGLITYGTAAGSRYYQRNGSRIIYAGFVWPLILPWLLFRGLRGAWRAAEFDVPKFPKKKRDKHPTDW